MGYYVQFLEINNMDEVTEAIGFDSVFILDGRNSLETMELDAMRQFHMMNKNIHHYCGWRIMKGKRFDNSVMLREWIHTHTKKSQQIGTKACDCKAG